MLMVVTELSSLIGFKVLIKILFFKDKDHHIVSCGSAKKQNKARLHMFSKMSELSYILIVKIETRFFIYIGIIYHQFLTSTIRMRLVTYSLKHVYSIHVFAETAFKIQLK